MTNKSPQSQSAGDSAEQYQAGNDIIINQGMSYTEVKEIALDVFKANFIELSGQASSLAKERAEDITEQLLGKLVKVSDSFQFASDPDFQYSMYVVQREYARTGNDELGDLLTDILVERSQQTERDILQVVLSESLLVAPKLTSEQISALALTHSLTKINFSSAENLEELDSIFSEIHQHVQKASLITESAVLHLEYAGTLSINHIVMKDIKKKVFDTYAHLSAQDFDYSVVNEDMNRFTEELYDRAPSLANCTDIFNSIGLYRVELTSVGMLLGLANLKRIAPWIDYDIWIN